MTESTDSSATSADNWSSQTYTVPCNAYVFGQPNKNADKIRAALKYHNLK